METSFLDVWRSIPLVLTEGAVVERLRREPGGRLHPVVENTALLYDPVGRRLMEGIYREYLDAARNAGLPLLLLTPTWRANGERLKAAGLAERPVQADAFEFLDGLRREAAARTPILIGGLMGCRGDAFDPHEAMTEGEAETFHAPQAAALAQAGVDLLYGATLPALSEALGMARAMARTGLPYILGFPMRPEGTLLDGTPLREAEASLDRIVPAPSVGLMGHCVHPSNFSAAMEAAFGAAEAAAGRWIGLQANASTLPPEALDGADQLLGDTPEILAAGIATAASRWGLKILGGCCGTDARLISAVADCLKF